MYINDTSSPSTNLHKTVRQRTVAAEPRSNGLMHWLFCLVYPTKPNQPPLESNGGLSVRADFVGRNRSRAQSKPAFTVPQALFPGWRALGNFPLHSKTWSHCLAAPRFALFSCCVELSRNETQCRASNSLLAITPSPGLILIRQTQSSSERR